MVLQPPAYITLRQSMASTAVHIEQWTAAAGVQLPPMPVAGKKGKGKKGKKGKKKKKK